MPQGKTLGAGRLRVETAVAPVVADAVDDARSHQRDHPSARPQIVRPMGRKE